jgi:DNA-binding CsgD family transcriptional regulator
MHLVVVEGGEGSGKRALIEAFLTEVGGNGPVTVRVKGIEDRPPVPWGVLRAIMARLAGANAADRLGASDPQAFPTLVAQKLVGYLRRGQHGLVLFLDDAEWADEQSMMALLHAAALLRDVPVLLIVSYQTGESRSFPADDDSPGLPRAWRQVIDGKHGQRLRLGGLPPEDIVRLVAANGHPELSPGDARWLSEATSGNPAHILELLPTLKFGPVITDDEPFPVPRKLASAIAARLARSSPEAQALVSAAAVLGQQFSFASLRDVSGIASPRQYIDEVKEAGWLVDVPGSGGHSLAFRRATDRAAVYGEMKSTRRTELHRRCVQQHVPDSLRHRIAVADGLDDTLADDLRQAASGKLRASDMLGAAYYLQRAMDVASPGPERVGLLLTAVESLLVAGKSAAAAEYAGQLEQAPADPWRDYVLGYQRLLAGHPVQATELLRGGLAALHRGESVPAGAPPDLRARIATQLAVLGIVMLSYPSMVEYGTAAVEAGSPEPWVRGFAWLAKTVGLALAGSSEQALGLLANAGQPGSESGLEGLAARGIVRLWTDDLDGAAGDLSAMFERATQGEALRTYQAIGFLGEAEYRRGRLAESAYFTGLALANAQDNERYWDYPLLSALAAYPLAAQWPPGAAEHLATQADRWARAIGTGTGLAYAGGAWAAIAQARSDPERLLAAAEQIHENYDSREPGTHLFGPVRADALVQLGQLSEAEKDLQRFLDGSAATGRRSATMTAARVAAQLASARGDHELALRECERARNHALELGMPLETGRIELLTAQCEHRAGRVTAAARTLRTAYRRFVLTEASAYARLAESAGQQWGIEPDPFKVLTVAEFKIANLACQGLTREAIGTQARVERKTVDTHLGNIYKKLGIKSQPELKSLLYPGQ